tara:strand:- start:287 stop:634 length:348 start_codon:yes stop_codon:yes gene_type:complete
LPIVSYAEVLVCTRKDGIETITFERIDEKFIQQTTRNNERNTEFTGNYPFDIYLEDEIFLILISAVSSRSQAVELNAKVAFASLYIVNKETGDFVGSTVDSGLGVVEREGDCIRI